MASRTTCSAACWIAGCPAAGQLTRHTLAQAGARHQRLDVGAQYLDRVTGRRAGTVDHAVGMATSAVCTSRLGEAGPAVTPAMLWMCLASSDEAIEAILAESAAISLPPSARENTMMAAAAVTCPAAGKALSCKLAARIDS